jgi:hypothetical protein
MPLNKKLRLAGSIFDTVLALLAKQAAAKGGESATASAVTIGEGPGLMAAGGAGQRRGSSAGRTDIDRHRKTAVRQRQPVGVGG